MVRIVPFVQVQGFSTATAAGQLVGGNAAGVVLPEYCVGLSPAQKQDVAAALGFSETVFVPMIDGENVTLQFFTPEGEVDLCGHATIASMGLLHSLSRLGEATAGTLHTRGGAVRFTIEAHGPSRERASVLMEQLPPRVDSPLASDEQAALAAALGSTLLDPSWPPRRASTGLWDIMVALPTTDALNALAPDWAALSDLSAALDVVGVHAFCREGRVGSEASPFLVRNFAPRFGINEESATGTSNCALACALSATGALTPPGGGHATASGAEGGGPRLLHFSQGEGMGLPSRVVVTLPEVSGPAGGRPTVGGLFHRVTAGRVRLSAGSAVGSAADGAGSSGVRVEQDCERGAGAPLPSPLPVSIRQLRACETVPLREKVLWPGRPEMCTLAEDDQPTTLHLGAFADAPSADTDAAERVLLVGVLSLFAPSSPGGRHQFRKLAVAHEAQGRGVGTELVAAAAAAAQRAGASALCCHAREAQTAFYERLGFRRVGAPFTKYQSAAAYVEMESSVTS